MSTIQIRIDEQTKKKAKKILDELGLDMSSAVKMYLRQVAIQKRIPMELLTENHFTAEQEDAILTVAKQAREGKNISKPLSTKQALKHLDLL